MMPATMGRPSGMLSLHTSITVPNLEALLVSGNLDCLPMTDS
jgi:hypothetical protein